MYIIFNVVLEGEEIYFEKFEFDNLKTVKKNL